MANGIIGQVHIGNDDYLIGSTLFGNSTTIATAPVKQVTLLSNATYPAGGVVGLTVHVKFDHGNTEPDSTKLKLQINSDTAYPIANPNGALTWADNSIISFTFDGENWVMNSSAIDGSSIQNLTLGQITNDGKLNAGPALVVTNANKEITTGVAFGNTSDGTYLDKTGAWTKPTDTKYGLVVGAANNATANAAVADTVNSIFLNLLEDGAVKTNGSHKIVGTGGVKVSSDTNGNITINGKEGTVTSIKIATTAPLTGGSSTATTTTGNYTLGLATGYGETQNPYNAKSAHFVLAGPENGAAAAPDFRALVTDDIPDSIARLASPTFTGTPKAPTVADATDSSTAIATTAFVAAAINSKLAANDAMQFKGVLSDPANIPATHQAGDTYRITAAGNYAGYECEVGDLLICTTDGTSADNSHWTVAQTNIDGSLFMGSNSLTPNELLVADGATGKVKSSGYTIATPSAGGILYGSGTNAYSVLAAGTANKVLTMNAAGTAPIWADAQHYTSYLYVTTASGTGNTQAALTNNNVYLRLFENSTARSTHKISGAGATSVTADANANIIITSTDTQFTSAGSTNALTSLTVTYTANGTTNTETPSTPTAVAMGAVENGILYMKSITYSTTSVSTGVVAVTT